MEQAEGGVICKKRDAKPFYRNVYLIKNCDFIWRDGQRYMPTQSELATIRTSPRGQYEKKVEFYRSMSKEMVVRKLEETFPYLSNKSYSCKAVTSRPSKDMSTSHDECARIWDGETIWRNIQGNSALYILEDEKNDYSAHQHQPKLKRRYDELTSCDQSQQAASELSSLRMSGPEKQLTCSGTNTRNGSSHPIVASRLALQAETSGAENGALQEVIRLPENQQSGNGTRSSASYTTVVFGPTPKGLESDGQYANERQGSRQETLPNLFRETGPHPPLQQAPVMGAPASGESTTIPTSSADAIESSLSQLLRSVFDDGIDPFPDSHPLFSECYPDSSLDLPPNEEIPEKKSDLNAEKYPTKMPVCLDSEMADDNDHTGTSGVSNFPPPTLGFHSSEISDRSADNNSTTSGVSELGQNFSSGDVSPNEEEQFEFSVIPERVPLQGGPLFRIKSNRAFPENLEIALAIFQFEHPITVYVNGCGNDCLDGENIPPSNKPGKVNILLKRANGKVLGKTEIWYYNKKKEAIREMLKDPEQQSDFFRSYSEMLMVCNNATASGTEAQNHVICGSTEPVQMLYAFVCVAAEIGAEQFIKIIFNSSAGRVIYDLYKDNSVLPEAIAREYGHEKIAVYLEEITGRFSKEASDTPNYPQTIDWSELIRAAEEAQKQPSHSSEGKSDHLERNFIKDTGYLGDIDTSSNGSCESVSSEFEDDIPLASSKVELDYLADQLSEVTLVYKDQEFGVKEATLNQRLMSFSKTGHFHREQVNSTVANKVVLPTKEGWVLSLSQESFILETHGLRHLRGLNRCDISFFLGSEKERIQSHLITEYERWFFLFNFIKDSSLHNQTFASGCGQFVQQIKQEIQTVMMGASSGCVEDIPCIKSTRELLTTSDNPELAVQWDTTQGSTKYSTSNVWVLTCLYRPARNILFIYVADNSDVFPHKVYFDDDEYELSTQRWQWQRHSSSLFNVQNRLQEMRKLSEQVRPEFGPTPLPTWSAKILPQVQGKHVLRQPECCPTWLYIMVRQCLVYVPEERPPLIAIFDAISSRTSGAHSISTWLSQYNQLISSPLIKCQSEDPCLVNDETNHFFETLYEEHREDLAKDESLTAFTLTIDSERGYLDKDWPRNIRDELAKSASSTAFTLTINGEEKDLDRDRGRGLEEGLANSTSLTAFTLTINSEHGYLYGDWERGLGEELAKSRSLTAFTLAINIEYGYIGNDWGRGLGKELAKSTSLTALTLTIHIKRGDLCKDWGRGLGEGLANSTSLTAFTLTINSEHGDFDGDWVRRLGEGLAKSASLTAFTLTINSERLYQLGNWGRGLGEGLANSTSLTAFTLTINGKRPYLEGDWGRGLGEGLASSTSLTAFTLSINSEYGGFDGDWGRGLGGGLANSTSLTAFTLTINSEHGYLCGDWARDLGEGLAKSTSLTAFTLTINSEHGYLRGDWARGLGEGLAKSTSLTAFTLTINSGYGYLRGDWEGGLGEGLAKSTSLTAFTFTINSEHGYLRGDWARGLGEGLAKSTSLTAFTFTINNEHGFLHGDSGRGLGEGLAKSTSLTTFTLTINSKRRYLYGDWARGLGEGLANSTSLTAFTLTINSEHGYLYGDWGRGLGNGLANSTSITAFTLTINSKPRYLYGDWVKGLVEGLVESTSITALILTTINNDYLTGDFVESLRRVLQNSKLLFSSNVRISDSSYLGGCFSSFDVDSGFQRSPPLCQWNRQINHEEKFLDSGSLSFSKYSTKLTKQKMKKYDAKKERMPKECTKKYDDEIFVGKKKTRKSC